MKIAITGKSALHLVDAPWSNYDWQIWHLNFGFHNNRLALPRFDKYFEIHREKDIQDTIINQYSNPDNLYEEYKQFLIENQEKLVINNLSFLPNAEIYPYKEIKDYFNTTFFKNTISFMIAYALYKYPDLEELGIYGVELHQDAEYHDEEDCVNYWIGRAEAIGVKVTTSNLSNLFKPDEYYSNLFEDLKC